MDDRVDLSRIVVVGTSCSGKSTFAGDLAARLGTDHVELDQLYWLPDWVVRDRGAFRALVTDRISGDRWVLDGNYSAVRDIVWPHATAVIWLDYPFFLVLWRSLRRTIHRVLTGREICNGNRETWRKAFFSRDSILLWVVTTYHRRRRDYQTLFASGDYPETARIRLPTPAAALAFLTRLRPT